TTVWVVFAATAGAFIWSALMLFRLLGVAEPPLTVERPPLLEELTAGFRAIARDRRLRLLVGLFSAQTLVNGAFVVLVTVSALELLHLGPSGVGYLNAAVGVGGLGGGLLPLLIDALGVRWALVVVGSVLPILCALTTASLARLDIGPMRGPQLELLRAIPIFSPLSPPVLEQLATRLVPVKALKGDEIVRRGDHGDRFYVVGEGEV